VINQWNRKLGKWRKTNAALSKDDFRNAIKPLFLYPCLITAACDRQTGLPKIQITPIKKKYFFFWGGGLGMENVCIFYVPLVFFCGHLVNFKAIWYITYIWYIVPNLVCCARKNLATLM
jgi:hypothetical protein